MSLRLIVEEKLYWQCIIHHSYPCVDMGMPEWFSKWLFSWLLMGLMDCPTVSCCELPLLWVSWKLGLRGTIFPKCGKILALSWKKVDYTFLLLFCISTNKRMWTVCTNTVTNISMQTLAGRRGKSGRILSILYVTLNCTLTVPCSQCNEHSQREEKGSCHELLYCMYSYEYIRVKGEKD